MHENSVYEGWNFEGDNGNKIGDESFMASSYGEGVFDLIQDIFNVQVEEIHRYLVFTLFLPQKFS